MKRFYTIVCILLTILLFVFIGNLYITKTTQAVSVVIKDMDGNSRIVNVSTQLNKRDLPPVEGDELYTPSKLEWLVLTLNSRRVHHSNYKIYYEASRHDSNKVIVNIRHDDLPLEKLERLNQDVQIGVFLLAKSYRWNWVKVDVIIKKK